MSRVHTYWVRALRVSQRYLARPQRDSRDRPGLSKRASRRISKSAWAHEAHLLGSRRLEPRRLLDAALPGVLVSTFDGASFEESSLDEMSTTIQAGRAQVGESPDRSLDEPEASLYAGLFSPLHSNTTPHHVVVVPLGPHHPFREIAESETAHAFFSFRDPNIFDSHTVQVDWGDGSEEDNFSLFFGQRLGIVSHQYLDDNPSGTSWDLNQVQITVTDNHGASGNGSGEIRVNNIGPSNLQLQPLDTISENSISQLQLTFEDPGILDAHHAQVDWGDGSTVETWDVASGDRNLQASHTYADNGIYTIQVQLFDDDLGVVSGRVQQQVENIDPILTGILPIPTVEEGQAFTLASLQVGLADAGFDNPSNPHQLGGSVETFSARTIDWGAGSAPDPISSVQRTNGGPGRPTTAEFEHRAHVYADNGRYTVTVLMADDDNLAAGQVVERKFAIDVLNVAPNLALTSEKLVVDEGSLLTIANLGTFTDPGFDNRLVAPATAETFSYTIDWGDGTVETGQLPATVVSGSPGVLTTGSLESNHRYADNNVDGLHQLIDYTVIVRLSDDDGGTTQGSFDVTVNNVDPTLMTLNGTDIDRLGDTTLSGSFFDPGADTFIVLIDWQDGSVEQVPLGGSTPQDFSVTHHYFGPPDPLNPAADVDIQIRLLDDDLGFDTGLVSVSNTGDGTRPVRIDTTPQVPRLVFPKLVVAESLLESNAVNLEIGGGTDLSSAVGDTKATGEHYFLLRVFTPQGEQGAGYRLKADSLQDLPGLFRTLPDNHYAIYLVRPETGTLRLVLEVNVRNGKVIDTGDDSEGARDRPPTEAVQGAIRVPVEQQSNGQQPVEQQSNGQQSNGQQSDEQRTDKQGPQGDGLPEDPAKPSSSALLTTPETPVEMTNAETPRALEADRQVASATPIRWRRLRGLAR
jgi:hypothetical protein